MSKKEDKLTQAEIETKVQQQQDSIKTQAEEARKSGDAIGFLKITLSNPPYSTEKEEIKIQSLFLVHQALQAFTTEKFNEEVFSKITEEELYTLFDYMNKTFEVVSLNKVALPYPQKVNASYFLKLYAKFIELKGKSIIIRGVSRKKSLVSRNDQWTY